MATVTITHSEISAATAGKLGSGHTADSVNKVVTEYSQQMFDLIMEKRPGTSKDITLVETPIAALKIKNKESGIVKNPDGTETKVGTNYTVSVALPNHFLKALNADVLEGVAKAASAVKNIVKAAKKAA
jgi:hypothetical protein